MAILTTLILTNEGQGIPRNTLLLGFIQKNATFDNVV